VLKKKMTKLKNKGEKKKTRLKRYTLDDDVGQVEALEAERVLPGSHHVSPQHKT
jgi:hypothetical protein